jgi:hypothetical protein
VPSEVAQPIRWWLAVHYRVQHAPQGYKNILYQIEYFTCNPIPSEYIRRGRNTRSHTQSIQNNGAQDVGFYVTLTAWTYINLVSCVSVTIRFLITHTSTDQSTIMGIPLGGLPTKFRRHTSLESHPLYYALASPLFETWEETLIRGSTIALFLVKPILVLLTSWVSSLYKLISSTNRWTLCSKCQTRCRC